MPGHAEHGGGCRAMAAYYEAYKARFDCIAAVASQKGFSGGSAGVSFDLAGIGELRWYGCSGVLDVGGGGAVGDDVGFGCCTSVCKGGSDGRVARSISGGFGDGGVSGFGEASERGSESRAGDSGIVCEVDVVTAGCESSAKLCSGDVGEGRGKNWARNRAWKEEKKRKRELKKATPAWRVGAKPLSSPSTVVTVDSRTAEEVEAARTLAVRRTFENKLAVAKTKYQLSSFADKEKSEAIRRLEVAKLEEKFNTTKAKSQASYKKCASPLDSVGSAGSAGEFAWKQEIRKRDAVQKKSDYLEKQLEKAMLYLSEEGKRVIAEMPEPYIPSDEDIAAEDADICPFLSYEEMEMEAEKFIGVGVRW